ncbi:MAG: Lrp/AsnC family transcriptional regulator [Candidatus Micrarchaeota archaeon]|nr:Lrp/AsnC family transcriptional regulator [Candidatus Micrarchaeota archaeon]
MAGKLDDTDLEILSILEKDAKARMHAIARKLCIPASTVHHRIKGMEKEGVIAGYSVKKNYRKMGFGLKAHVLVFADLALLKRMKKTQQDICSALSRVPGVESSEIITGEADLLITVRAHDMDEFRKVLLDRIQAIEGITETKTMMVMG